MPCIVYSRKYNIGFFGLERLHPFDSRKYGRAWKVLKRHFGSKLRTLHLRPHGQATREELERVHASKYLEKLKQSRYVARALELPPVAHLPGWMVDRQVLQPMRWATRGTMDAARAAIDRGLSINLSGGYHHAKPNRGEGFSIYADVGVAVAALRDERLISESDRVVYIDTDAHQGNGVCHTFMNDSRVFVFDIYNRHIFPVLDQEARHRIDCDVGVSGAISDTDYLSTIQNRLPGFLDSVGRVPVGLAVYNAGTDVFAGDPLGGFGLSEKTIFQRDLYVVSELRRRGIPTVMVLSGGYTKQSYQLVANSVIGMVESEMKDWQS